MYDTTKTEKLYIHNYINLKGEELSGFELESLLTIQDQKNFKKLYLNLNPETFKPNP